MKQLQMIQQYSLDSGTTKSGYRRQSWINHVDAHVVIGAELRIAGCEPQHISTRSTE